MSSVLGMPDSSRKREDIHFEHLSVKDGLSQISVMSIFQDKDGFLWFGTRNGLNKYDGYHFQIFAESDKEQYISSSHITAMAEDRNGQMWVGTKNGLNRYDRKTARFVSYYNDSTVSTSLSNSNIARMKRDSRGNLWIGTVSGLDIYQTETDNFMHFTHEGFPAGPVYGIEEDHEGNIWIGMESGLYVYNPHVEQLRVYKHQDNNPHSLTVDRISTLFCDSKGRMWIGMHQAGVCLYDERMDYFIRYKEEDGLNNNTIRCFVEDPEGYIWAGTFNGLSKYDPLSGKFSNAFGSWDNTTIPIGNFSVYSALCDRSGTVWVGTYSGGISYYNATAQRFRVYDPGMQKKVIYGIVGPIKEHAGGLWIGTEGGGLLFFDREKVSYTYYHLPQSKQQAYSRNIIKSLLPDGNILWVGTADNRILQFDVLKRQFVKQIVPPWGNIYYALVKDDHQNLWMGSSGQNSIGYMASDGKFTFPLRQSDGEIFDPVNVRCILQDGDDRFFILTFDYGLYYYDASTRTVRQWLHREDDPSGIAHSKLSSVIKTKNGRIWIAMAGGGIAVLDRETGAFTHYDRARGLAGNTVYAIVEDADEKLWLSTSSGISMFDPVTEKFTNYGRDNGITISEFTPNSGIVTAENEVFFGGNDGFISFQPQNLQSNTYIPPMVITSVSINNQPVLYDENNDKKPLRLNYKQSSMSIEFSALNYIYSHQNQYAYRLEGFDSEWIYIGNRREAYYTNLPPGKYTFHVKGSNNDGVWNETGASFQLVITPPPWNTWWAWLIYILTALTILYFIVRYARIKIHLENDIRLKHLEQENMKMLHQAKIDLFTSFAHELRTPLTLILSPLEDILQGMKLAPELSAPLKLMQKNANRLLHTINSLLDFRKKEAGHLQLKAAQGNIVKFTTEIVIAFNELARIRNIRFSHICESGDIQVWYDRDLLEKVLFNILSNAFKHTPDGGEITFRLVPEKRERLQSDFNEKTRSLPAHLSDWILFEISDTGKGIPETELEQIFEPFYQVHTKDVSPVFGSGIGLNFSKGVIELHQGIIWADNNADQGSVFRLVLPLGNRHLKESELETNYKNSEDVSNYIALSSEQGILPETPQPLQAEDFKYTVLIVEDNVDVRYYIQSHVKKHYKVYQAANGFEAFDLALKHLPDLIISDIMMPEMDGLEFCRRLKEDIRTGHIPVILLTARITVMQIQEGFETGADEYITKPFNANLLLTRIKNLINTRENLKKLFGNQTSALFPELPTSPVDSRFMDSMYEYIHKHLDETGLNMDLFCREIGMSRSSFYRKLQSISNLTPVELIRNTRLQYALQYLRETDLNITEIAYKTGFSSQSYFTKTFKAFFKQSPSEVRRTKGNDL
ncbi:hybrid sensor histidine kinase/response regulator [Bacteroidia bacterium]|nr:hybrid sensor histidine kinase/response regulator [Bacteroidia bacterium]